MVITDELIAAYIDGNTTVEERRLVHRYLAIHPEEQDLVFALMDEVEECSVETEVSSVDSFQKEQSFNDIAYAAAAFAPRKVIDHRTNVKRLVKKSQERRLRMSALWKELQENE